MNTDPQLLALLRAASQRSATPAERAAQRKGWVVSEIAMGSDSDEAAYREAFRNGDTHAMARLEREADCRRARAERVMENMGL